MSGARTRRRQQICTVQIAWIFSMCLAATSAFAPWLSYVSTTSIQYRNRYRSSKPVTTAKIGSKHYYVSLMEGPGEGGVTNDNYSESPKNIDTTEEPKKKSLSKPKRPRRLVRLIDNLWYAMTAPFPDLRKLSRNRDADAEFAVSLRLQDGMAAVMAYLATGVICFHFFFEKWSIIDSLYFACVCFSTVGYGDLAPQTPGGKMFTCAFGLVGIALLGAAVATIGSKLVQAEIDAAKLARKESQKRLMQVYDRMPKLVTSIRRASNKEHKKIIAETKKHLAALRLPHLPHLPPKFVSFLKAVRWIIQSLLVVVFGGLVIGRLEGWSWQNSIYYSFITASTIGLGDIAPVTPAGRLAAVIMIPMTVAAAGEILASVGLALVEQRQKRIFDNQLRKGLTEDHLKAMDADGNGKVSREEYVFFMLMEMGLVNDHEIKELQSQFDRLDVTRSGYLDHGDLVLMAKLRRAGLVE